MKKSIERFLKILLIIIIIIFITLIVFIVYSSIKEKYKTVYYAEDFGIEIIRSSNDKNNNGIDDYTDILLGARRDAENKPKYISKYYSRWISTR